MSQSLDIAIIGSGIVGLAHALEASKKGRKVTVFDRDPRPLGASIRNFGMIQPLSMPQGAMRERASRSVSIWKQLFKETGLWHNPIGAMVLAYADDEQAILEEFSNDSNNNGYHCDLLSPSQVLSRNPAVKQAGLKAAVHHLDDIIVNPRLAIPTLIKYLQEQYGVDFKYKTAIGHIDGNTLISGQQRWQANKIIVCSGVDFETLFPEVYQNSGAQKCKLQMLKTVPQPSGFKLEPFILGGLSMQHYEAFQDCAAMPALKQRLAEQYPIYNEYGIHVMACQHNDGSLIIGDSHEYDDCSEPFNRAFINELVLDYLSQMIDVPTLKIAEEWQGVYPKHPEKYLYEHNVSETVKLVSVMGGTGMTTSFGVAQDTLKEWL